MTAFAALADTLRALAGAIRPLTDEAFTAREFFASGSIGAHVRHCLDHAWALERGIAIGEICYDHRERDTVVERDCELAGSRLGRAAVRLGGIADDQLDRPVTLIAQMHADGRTIRAGTTVGRELAFVISHTIHHSALVAVLLEHADRDVPERFGLAPTTPGLRQRSGQAEASCAR
jgi:uncharacterized damage-inducible protein DinB